MSGNFSDSGEKKLALYLHQLRKCLRHLAYDIQSKHIFELNVCVSTQECFSLISERWFFFCGWQQWCVSVPCGVLIWQTGCQFLQTLLFWSALKLGRFFIFNSDFRKGGEDIVWPTHHRNRWYFLWITFSTNRWSGELTKNGKKKTGMVTLN